jgi:small conductance mechanosensitive channel
MISMLLEPLLSGSIRPLLEKIILSLIIIVIASIIAKTIATAITGFGKRESIPDSVTYLMKRIVTYFIAFIGIVLILDIFNFQITTFVASFGIVGLIIGIGAQAIISNFISGILIMFEKPFIIGDFIDITGFGGVVEDISLRSTRIKTFDGRIITIPNSTLTSNAVINYSRTGEIQVKIPVSFKADVDIEKVSKIMRSIAKRTQGVRQYGIEVLVTGITRRDTLWNVELELRFWLKHVLERDIIVSNVTGGIKEELAKERVITFSPSEQDLGT